jgi:preprotein translocase subunit SecB
MSKEKPLNQEIPPTFRVNGLFVKDISFENPRAPGIFLQPMKNPPKMGVSIDVAIRNLKETSYEVTLRITTKAEENNSTMFLVEVVHGGVFSINPAIPEEHHARILFIDCAAVIFPFARRIISDLTAEGGYPPVLLEPVNFEGIYRSKTGKAA